MLMRKIVSRPARWVTRDVIRAFQLFSFENIKCISHE
jgi:hypothetical protein